MALPFLPGREELPREELLAAVAVGALEFELERGG